MNTRKVICYALFLTYSLHELYQKQVIKPVRDFMQRPTIMVGGTQKEEQLIHTKEERLNHVLEKQEDLLCSGAVKLFWNVLNGPLFGPCTNPWATRITIWVSL
jgi:hypothetical protein